MNLSTERWVALSSHERDETARRVAQQLPAGFSFQGVQQHPPSDFRHPLAVYETTDATFVLIPGGPVTLGFDASRPFEPNPDELQSWQDTADEYGINKTLHEFVVEVTLRPRCVELPPLLVETSARRVGTGSHAAVAARGFRYPTSDEWEYFCGAGAPTLFRWGDHVPCDRYPIDERVPPYWNAHRQANALGLLIASNPYDCELTAEVGVTRGGDGGSMICGGAGFYVGWLTLATAYFEDHACRYDPFEQTTEGYTIGRRVLELR